MTDDVIRLREEISEQYRALNDLKQMAASYGFDIFVLLQMRKKQSNGYTLVT